MNTSVLPFRSTSSSKMMRLAICILFVLVAESYGRGMSEFKVLFKKFTLTRRNKTVFKS